MMAAAKREMPIGGRRAKMGTGRARRTQLGIWVDDDHATRLAAYADGLGITRTALIERWIDEYCPPMPESYQAPE